MVYDSSYFAMQERALINMQICCNAFCIVLQYGQVEAKMLRKIYILISLFLSSFISMVFLVAVQSGIGLKSNEIQKPFRQMIENEYIAYVIGTYKQYN